MRLLKADGIDAVFRQNATGRITGATFIDHRTKTVLNGSRLGKSYSANVFQELFNNPHADRASLLPKLTAPAPAAPRQQADEQAKPQRSDISAADGEDPHVPARIISAPGAARTPQHGRKPVPCSGRPAGTAHRRRPHVAGGVRSHAPKPFTQTQTPQEAGYFTLTEKGGSD